MTISAGEDLVSGPYAGNGVATIFDYGFKIYAESELEVIRKNADLTRTPLVLAVDYSVQNVGTAGGGTITLTSGAVLPTGASMTIEPAITPSQDRQFSAQSSLTLLELEQALDKLTSLTRQIIGLSDRLLITPVGVSGGVLEQGTYGKVIVFDGVGGAFAGPDVTQIVTPPATSARFLPNKASPDWTTRPDLTALQQGDLYFNTTTNKMRVYAGVGFTDAAAGMSGANNLSELTNVATARATLGLGDNFGSAATLTTDLNTAIGNGFYRNAAAAANAPTTAAGLTLTERVDATNVVQMHVPLNADALYVRRFLAGVWQPWVQQGRIGRIGPLVTTSGTLVDFIGIPAWATEVEITFDGVSGTALSGNFLAQLGTSGSVEVTGYLDTSIAVSATPLVTAYTTGFGMPLSSTASNAYSGHLKLTRPDATQNVWVASGVVRLSTNDVFVLAGTKTLAAALDRVRLSVSSGAFDAGRATVTYK